MDFKPSYTSLASSMSREDEESSQVSSLDTLLEKQSVRWRDEKNRDIEGTENHGIRLSTALIIHTLLIAAFGGTWLLLLVFYGYEYPYGPNLIQSPIAYPVSHFPSPLLRLLTPYGIRSC
jgi:hypothetical protein